MPALDSGPPEQVLVRFEPAGVAVQIPRGDRIFDTAIDQGISFDTVCGGSGTCGKCVVRVDDPEDVAVRPENRLHLTTDEIAEGFRLSCRIEANSDLVIHMPIAKSEPDHEPRAIVGHHGRAQPRCGFAVDIGTTTVVAYLVDLDSGTDLAVAAAPNSQSPYGDDTLSRLSRSQVDPDSHQILHNLIIEQLNRLFQEAANAAQVDLPTISDVCVVGNTAMHHLFLGLDVSRLGLSPFKPATCSPLTSTAAELGLSLQANTPVYALPVIDGFVGSDAVAMMLYSKMGTRDGVRMAIDIGTNSEIALQARDRVVVCSASAGPAFEGARIRFGMRAAAGAIDHVWMNEDVRLSVIDGIPPVGICGSALVDVVASMLDAGLIDSSGRLLRHDELSPRVSPKLGARLVDGETRRSSYFRLVLAGELDAPNDIIFTQRDIREFQLAKGSLRAGQIVLQQQLGVADNDLTDVSLAGAFGAHVSLASARRVGIVPPVDCLGSVGNAAGAGTRQSLLSSESRRRAEQLAARTEHVRLSGLAEFERVLPRAMQFPETEVGIAL